MSTSDTVVSMVRDPFLNTDDACGHLGVPKATLLTWRVLRPGYGPRAVPIQVPDDWDDGGLITVEEFCDLIRTPQRTVRDWRRRGVGPRWARFNGCGRLYITVAETRRLLSSATTSSRSIHTPGQEKPRG
ncbi:helix-turn-helix domain-containing protein [Nocardioides sp. W7]|uniref:helix-turn-helix domain-containing protein n=1 Tax=Nocardioides sp. W7 TaxID=2931390 RepID=UPI001FD5B657|nr:helix-turn-helix domain-containing protein [Nocardioides sp. W7]